MPKDYTFADHVHEDHRNVIERYIFSSDHKVIGIQFLFSGLIFFIVGGLLALGIRWQLAWPWSPMPVLSKQLWSSPSLGYQMPPEFYNKLFTMHGTAMIFFVVIPILTGTFGNFLIPLMIGARQNCNARAENSRPIPASWHAKDYPVPACRRLD